MKNFFPTIICLITLLFVAWRDSTFNIFPPASWYDVAGILALVGLVASFAWGLVQQAEWNSVQNTAQRKNVLYNPRSRLDTSNPPRQSGVPTNPPKGK